MLCMMYSVKCIVYAKNFIIKKKLYAKNFTIEKTYVKNSMI